MTSRSACEPLPKPTLSPFALARPGTFLRVGFFTAAVWCVPALRVPLVHSLINHFRKKKKYFRKKNAPGAAAPLEAARAPRQADSAIPATSAAASAPAEIRPP